MENKSAKANADSKPTGVRHMDRATFRAAKKRVFAEHAPHARRVQKEFGRFRLVLRDRVGRIQRKECGWRGRRDGRRCPAHGKHADHGWTRGC